MSLLLLITSCTSTLINLPSTSLGIAMYHTKIDILPLALCARLLPLPTNAFLFTMPLNGTSCLTSITPSILRLRLRLQLPLCNVECRRLLAHTTTIQSYFDFGSIGSKQPTMPTVPYHGYRLVQYETPDRQDGSTTLYETLDPTKRVISARVHQTLHPAVQGL
jgi:hypothetical protein